MICTGCPAKKESDAGNNQSVPEPEAPVILSDDPDLEHTIPMFSHYTNYDNNLSTVASDIEYVLLDKEPHINDFHTSNQINKKLYLKIKNN